MSLLAPLGLLALALLPLVVAIHLWRVRHRHYEVASTLLWERLLTHSPRPQPRHLPTRWVLLLLQALAVLGGAAALARPAFTQAGAQRHLIVAVDTSLSMSAHDLAPTRLERARAAVRSTIAGLGSNDTMTLVDVGSDPHVVLTSGDPAALRRAVDSLAGGVGASSLGDDLPLLSGLVATTPESTLNLYAARDTNATTLAVLRTALPQLHLTLVGSEGADHGVADLTVSCTARGGIPYCEAFARLVNTGPTATVQVSIVVQGPAGTLAEDTQPLRLAATSATPIELPLPTQARSIELRLAASDALPADDVAWAAVPTPIQRRVLLVTTDPNSALVQALHAMPNLRLTLTSPDLYSDRLTDTVDLTILDTTGAAISPPGNVLAINPSDGGNLFVATGTSNAPAITAARANDPLLQGVSLLSLVLSSATRAQLPLWAHADLSGDDGPLLFSGVTGGRHIAVLLFDPRVTAVSNASNLTTLSAFPTLLHNAVETLAPAAPLAASAGQVAAVPATLQRLTLTLPHGGSTALITAGGFAVLPPLVPGYYTLRDSAGAGSQGLAVNAAVPAGATSIGGTIPAVPGGGTVAASLTAPLHEGWGVAVLLMVALLSGEWWYYTRHT